MSILAGFTGALCCYVVMKFRQKLIIEPQFAEFGRMSKLVWEYDWNFYLTGHGSTKVFKEGGSTTYTFSGGWMYKLLMKDRPEQEEYE